MIYGPDDKPIPRPVTPLEHLQCKTMTGFESWKQYSAFSWFVMRKSRHILDAKNQRFLDVVIDTSQKRRGTIEKGAVLWRAQLGHSWRTENFPVGDGEYDSIEVEAPFPADRMVPQPDRASEGRVNPKGILLFNGHGHGDD